ncbi:MAG: hypothetical protein H6522_05450 [Mycolicibacterium sp.]|nr:hypothetical protein [Mycolicibacterium sp.]
MTAVLDGIFDAHGGLDYWRSLSTIDVEISAWGFLFTTKQVEPQNHARLTIDTREPRVILHDYPAAGNSTVLRGGQRVEIRDSAGSVLDARDNPREAFSHGRLLRWDAIDFAYFCGYAMWNYLTLPFLLSYPGVSVAVSDRQATGTSAAGGLPGRHSHPLRDAGVVLRPVRSAGASRLHRGGRRVLGQGGAPVHRLPPVRRTVAADDPAGLSAGSVRPASCRCRPWWPSTSTTSSRGRPTDRIDGRSIKPHPAAGVDPSRSSVQLGEPLTRPF